MASLITKKDEAHMIFGLMDGKYPTAWHGLGLERAGGLSAQEVREYVCPDPERYATLAYKYEGQWVEVPELRAIIVPNKSGDGATFLNTVNPETYGLLTNAQVLDIALEIVGESEYSPSITSALTLDGRKRFTVTFDLTKCAYVVNGDEHRSLFTVAHSHDHSLPLMALQSCIRVVCNNTFQAALREGLNASIKHTSGVHENASEWAAYLRTQLGLALNRTEIMERIMNEMVGIDMTLGNRGYAVLEELFPTEGKTGRSLSIAENRQKSVVELAYGGKGQTQALTAYALFNGITESVNHHNLGARDGGKDATEQEKMEAKYRRVMFQGGAELTRTALNSICRHAEIKVSERELELLTI